MKSRYFDKIEFWARELRLPLFWLIDPKHKIMSQDVLVLYKNNICHVYLLNEKEVKAAQAGFNFFSRSSNVKKYQAQVQSTVKSIDQIDKNVNKIKTLTNQELKKEVLKIIRFLDAYSNVYTKTEPFVLAEVEAQELKYKKLIQKLGQWRFLLRKKGELIFYKLIGIFLKEIARRFNLKLNDLFFYTFDELSKLFLGEKISKSVMEQRKKGYALINLKTRHVLLTGKQFKKLYTEIIIEKPKVDQLTGTVAMSGKVRGKVHVILHQRRDLSKEIAKFKKGEILVTEMTRPDTILACRKAVAIVTDEGGITSHAAIISREFKIPCVVGTKIATQILKDGDLVEVDADKGVVRILK